MGLSKTCLVLLFFSLIAPYSIANAQLPATTLTRTLLVQTTTGTLEGTVIDQQNLPLPGVLVRVINTTNGFEYGRRTDTTGTYRIDFLPAGEYDITAEKEGFQSNLLPKFLVE